METLKVFCKKCKRFLSTARRGSQVHCPSCGEYSTAGIGQRAEIPDLVEMAKMGRQRKRKRNRMSVCIFA